MIFKDHKILKYNLDIISAILLIIFGLLIILYSEFLFYKIVGSLISISPVLYLIIKSKGYLDLSTQKYTPKKSHYLLLNLLFFIILLFSIISLYFSQPYERPFSYFVAIIFLINLQIIEILFFYDREYSSFFLLKTIIIILSLVLSQSLLYPTVIGDDPFYHETLTNNFFNSGKVHILDPTSSAYNKFPIMHIIIGSTSLMTGLNYKLASLYSISFVLIVCTILLVYLLTRSLFDDRIARIASLFSVLSTTFLSSSISVIPYYLSVFWMILIIYILLREKKNILLNLLVILLMFLMIFTHTVGPMIMSVVLLVFLVSSKFFRIYFKASDKSPWITSTVPIFFIVALFSYWTYVSGTLYDFVDLIRWGFSIDFFSRGGITTLANQYKIFVPEYEYIFNTISLYIFWSFALIGMLYMISKKSDLKKFILISATIIVLGISVVSSFVQVELLSDRWFFIVNILMSIPFAVSIVLIQENLKNIHLKRLLIPSLTLLLSFLVIMGSISNIDDPLFKDNAVKAYLSSEVISLNTIINYSDEKLGVDSRLISTYGNTTYPYNKMYSIQNNIYMKDFKNEYINSTKMNSTITQNDTIILRKRLTEIISSTTNYYITLNYDPINEIEAEGWSRIYDSGTVDAFQYLKT